MGIWHRSFPDLAADLADMAHGLGWQWESKMYYFKPDEWMGDVDRFVAGFEALIEKHRAD